MTVPTKATINVILLVMMIIDAEAVRDIPEFLHICQVREPASQYETCVRNSINYLKPYLKMGVPEYNIPSLEPLKLKKLLFSPTNKLRIMGTDIIVYGASNFEITKIKLDFYKLFIILDVKLANIFINGNYDIDGNILLLPITGSGPMSGNFSDCIGTNEIQIKRYIDKDGIEKVSITDFKIKISVGKGSLRLDNLFNGNNVLGDVINSAINNNFELYLKEVLPLVEITLSDAFKNIADNILQQFSFAQLFPGL